MKPLQKISEQEAVIRQAREAYSPTVDPLRSIGVGPDVPDGSEAAEREQEINRQSQEFILGLVRDRFRREEQETKEHVAQTYQYYRQGAGLISDLALSVAFDRERSFQETAIEFVKQSAIIITQSIIENRIRLAQIRSEQAALEQLNSCEGGCVWEYVIAWRKSVLVGTIRVRAGR